MHHSLEGFAVNGVKLKSGENVSQLESCEGWAAAQEVDGEQWGHRG